MVPNKAKKKEKKSTKDTFFYSLAGIRQISRSALSPPQHQWSVKEAAAAAGNAVSHCTGCFPIAPAHQCQCLMGKACAGHVHSRELELDVWLLTFWKLSKVSFGSDMVYRQTRQSSDRPFVLYVTYME